MTYPGDNERLPSPSGQYTEMPHNAGAAHPLGPYAPRPVAGAHMNPPGDSARLPTPSGQYPHAGQSSGKYPVDASRPGGKQGTPGDNARLPTPSGQYEHAKSHDAKKDGGGMA